MKINSLNDFIKSMPTNLSTNEEKARYLYLELGKRSFYDSNYKYYMFGEEEQNWEYSYKIYKNPNIIICTTLAKQYAALLTKAGIKSEISYDGLHYFVTFYDKQGIEHKTDITNDLKNIQFGCKTSYFGKDTIEEQTLRDIDTKLGYISKEKSYTDDYWYLVKDIIQKRKLNNKEQLEFVLQSLAQFGDISKLGNTEIFAMYQKFVKFCLPDNSSTMFCSYRVAGQEEYVIEFKENDIRTKYILNTRTRLFEEKSSEIFEASCSER